MAPVLFVEQLYRVNPQNQCKMTLMISPRTCFPKLVLEIIFTAIYSVEEEINTILKEDVPHYSTFSIYFSIKRGFFNE